MKQKSEQNKMANINNERNIRPVFRNHGVSVGINLFAKNQDLFL